MTVYFNGVFTLSCPPTICLPVANRAVELWFTCAQCIPRVCVRTRVTLSNVTQTWDACLMLLTYKNCLFETFLQFMPLHLILGGCISSVWLRRVLAINRSVFVLCFCSLYSTSRKNILDSLVNDGAILRCTKKKKKQFTCACKNAKFAWAKLHLCATLEYADVKFSPPTNNTNGCRLNQVVESWILHKC